MVMIFTLVTAVQEKLNEIVDQIKTRREEEKKQKEKEAEEAEKVYYKAGFSFIILLICFFCFVLFWLVGGFGFVFVFGNFSTCFGNHKIKVNFI